MGTANEEEELDNEEEEETVILNGSASKALVAAIKGQKIVRTLPGKIDYAQSYKYEELKQNLLNGI